MILKNLILFPFFLYLLLQNVAAQSINGFQIFVSKEQFTSIEFHSGIENIAFAQKNPPYKVIFMGAKTIFLETSQEVKVPYDLSVIEGGRNHKFVIIYAQDVDQSKRDNDYSNLNQLKTLIKNFVPVAISSPTQNNSTKKNAVRVNPGKNPESSNNQKDSVNVTANSPVNINFYILIDEADRAKKSGQLQTAKAKYQQALQIQTDNSYAQAQLQGVNAAIENESKAKYNDAITKAKHASVNNNYDDAIEYFSLALEVKPQDPYANSQLADLQKKADAAKMEEANLQKNNLFESYIKAGDKALSDKSYESAETEYAEALKIKPNNSKAVLKFNAVSKQKIADSVEAAHQKTEDLFAGFLNAGDKAFSEKSYDAAKLSYVEAQKLKPGNSQIKLKLNSVNQGLYTGFCKAGDEALNKKSYAEAKDAYNEALKLKPNDVAALAKLKAVDKQKERDETEDKFKNYVITGDKALSEKSYELAAIAYTEALKIKSNDATVKTKLNSISQLIISDSLESTRKQNEDLYQGFIASGNKALNEKSYDEAKVSYSQALKIKPDDVFAKKQLDLVNQSLYLNFLNDGNTALSGKQYSKATDAYNEALKIKPNDTASINKLAQIENHKAQDKINEVYVSYINAGDKATGNKSYEEAKISYSEALKMKPGDSMVIAKIESLNQEIATDSLEVVRLKTEASFTGFINAAGEAANKRDYSDAIFSYTEALKVKPGNEYAISQITKIEQVVAQAKADSLNKLKDEQNKETAKNDNISDSSKAGNEISAVDPERSAVSEIEASMLLIKARFFKMGSDVGSTDESPMHTVKIDSFYISRFEVTQSQWQSIMGNNPSFFKNCDDCPVENVSWNDVMKFIERLNQITTKKYRLPTEAEWEYVAGTQNKKDNIDNIAWYSDNSKNKTHHIGLLQPDFLGVYDIFGNVAEWCSDWYSYATYRKNLSVNPTGPANGKEKVVRGGSWYDMEGAFRPSVRDKASPDKPSKKTGFRLVMEI